MSKTPFTIESPDPHTLLRGERKVLELIATRAPLHESLDTLCGVIDSLSGLRSSIFLLDRSGERLTFAAGPHVPDTWKAAVASFPITETPCGLAVTQGRQVVARDISTDPLCTSYRDAAEAAQIRAAWSTPFFADSDRPLGTFAVYAEEHGPPSSANLELAQRATHLASIAVDRHAAEQQLAWSRDQLRALVGKLMHVHDVERRRVAQLLRDTTAQDLAALKMLLARLSRTLHSQSVADGAVLTESVELADTVMTETRTLSYLLYPPFLDEAGLLSAIRWYAAGFAKRTGIVVDLDLPEMSGRLPQEIETTVFRVAQEALMNVHHHAESATAAIRLQSGANELILTVEDRGHGIAQDVVARLMSEWNGALVGIGVASIRERLRRLGGSLEITSTPRGTTLRAIVPLSESSSSS